MLTTLCKRERLHHKLVRRIHTVNLPLALTFIVRGWPTLQHHRCAYHVVLVVATTQRQVTRPVNDEMAIAAQTKMREIAAKEMLNEPGSR